MEWEKSRESSAAGTAGAALCINTRYSIHVVWVSKSQELLIPAVPWKVNFSSYEQISPGTLRNSFPSALAELYKGPAANACFT